jgi:hypothetical protein
VFVVGPKDLFFAGGIVSGTGGVLNEATPAIATAVALLALGGISVSYGVGGDAMAAVRGFVYSYLLRYFNNSH